MQHQVNYNVSLDDTFILVMGMSGAGKSAFVDACIESPTQIVGHGLDSGKYPNAGNPLSDSLPEYGIALGAELYPATFGPTIHTAHLLGRDVHLIDTSGFDDNRRSDVDVLREIVFWMGEASRVGIRIGGVVYLHSITAPRLSGSARRGLGLFKHICGRDAYHGVVLLTTGWDRLAPGTYDWQLAMHRQRQLETSFWADILDGGGTALAIRGSIAPVAVIEAILRESYTLVLGVQVELGRGLGSLAETSAGRMLLMQYEEDRKRGEDHMLQTQLSLQQAIQDTHDQNILKAREHLEEVRELIKHQSTGIQDLQNNIQETIRRERERIELQRKRITASDPSDNLSRYSGSEARGAEERNKKFRRVENGSADKASPLPGSDLSATKPDKPIPNTKLRYLASRVLSEVKAERVSAVAGVVSASLAAAAAAAAVLCTVM